MAAFNIPWNDQYTLLAWAAGITFGAIIIGWWIKRKFHIRQ
jgi:hypothetical protein